MNLSLLTHPYYLFDPAPSTISVFFWIFTAFFALTVISSIILRKKLTHWPDETRGLAKKLLRTYPKMLFWLGIIGLLVALFRYENVPYLSMRVITYLLVFFILGCCGKMLYVRYKTYEQACKNLMLEEEKKKYLPRKKTF